MGSDTSEECITHRTLESSGLREVYPSQVASTSSIDNQESAIEASTIPDDTNRNVIQLPQIARSITIADLKDILDTGDIRGNPILTEMASWSMTPFITIEITEIACSKYRDRENILQ